MDFLPLKRQSPISQTSRPKRARWYSVKLDLSPEREENSEDDQVLELKHFARPPYLNFDKVRVGTSRTCSLQIRNPLFEPQDVTVDKFPYKKGFSVAVTQFTVGPNENTSFNITWAPTEASDYREVVYFRTNTGCRTKVVLQGNAYKQVNKKKTQGRKILSPRNVLDKPRKSNIKEIIKMNRAVRINSLEGDTNNMQKDGKENGFMLSDKIWDFSGKKNMNLDNKLDSKFSKKNLEAISSDSPLRRQTILINKMFPNSVSPNKRESLKNYIPNQDVLLSSLNSRHQAIEQKNYENILHSSDEKKFVDTTSMNFSNECVAPAFDVEKHNLRRATFVKSTKLRELNDSLDPLSENSPLEDSLISDEETAIRRATHILPRPAPVPKIVFNNGDNNLKPSENLPLDDSIFSNCETNDRATKVFSKPVSFCPRWSNVTVRDERSAAGNPFLLQNSNHETFDSDWSRNETHNSFSAMFKTSSESLQRSDEIVSEQPGEATSKVTQPSKRNEWILRPTVKDTKSINLSDLDTSPFSSHVDINRLSTGTIVVANPVLSEDMLPHHSPDRVRHSKSSEARPENSRNKTQAAVKLSCESKAEPCGSSNSVAQYFGASPCLSGGGHVHNKTLDEVRRCSTGIKIKPPELLFISHLSSQEIAEEPEDLRKKEKFVSSSDGKSNLFPKSGSVGTVRVLKRSVAKPHFNFQSSARADRYLKSTKSSTFVKDDSQSAQKKFKSPLGFQIQSKSDSTVEKQKLKVTKQSSVVKRCEKQVSARRPLVASAAKSRKIPKTAQRKLSLFSSSKNGVPRHLNPFAAKNMYYDERWMEKQELAFTCWLNFVLTPPDELNSNTEHMKVDAAKLWVEGMKSVAPTRAPTKEDVSLKSYTAIRKMNRLRKASCLLYQSKPVVEVIKRLEIEVETGRLLVRKDRAMHADVGIKQKILGILLSYNPLWLRIGLETIYGEILPLQSNSDVVGLSRFIIHRLLYSPDIAAVYAHPTVPHLLGPGFEEEMKKFTLKKFLLIVHFLDCAKLKRLIDHDPCLFCKDAEFKSSKNLLLIFSREFLSGEGDVTRHLRLLGYNVSHQQMPLEEFDFSVTNLAVDLRCGLRLVRVLELLLQIWTLSATVRVPAISRLQKIHNNDIALKTLITSGIKLQGDISSRDIVDGHREKTLSLLWQIIFGTEISKLLDKRNLEEEIKSLQASLQFKADLAALEAIRGHSDSQSIVYSPLDIDGLYTENEILRLLLQWCQVVCAHYGVKVSNFTVSFSDGRAFCYLLHHYLPSVLRKERVKENTTLNHFEQKNGQNEVPSDLDDDFDNVWAFNCGHGECDSSMMNELVGNEKENLYLAFEKFQEIGGIPTISHPSDISNTIPDEKVIITQVVYVNSRLMDLSKEIRAARVIQIAWRKRHLKEEFKLLQKQIKAAIIIQRSVRKFLQHRLFIKQQNAAIVIQSTWRMFQAKKKADQMRYELWMKFLNSKATLIQAIYRGYATRQDMKKKQKAATIIQSSYRQWKMRSSYLKLKKVVTKIQCKYRATVKARSQRENYLRIRECVIFVQAVARGWLVRKQLEVKHQAAVSIQAAFRGWRVRNLYIRKRRAAINLQQWFRSLQEMWTCRHQYQKLKKSAILIQAVFRGYECRKEYKAKIQASIIIQSCVRRFLLQKRFQQLKYATKIIGTRWKAVLLGREERKCFLLKRQSVIVLQAAFKMLVASRSFKHKKPAVIKLQKFVRGMLQRKRYKKKKASALLIQAWWRSILLRNQFRMEFLQLKQATVIIQRNFKMVKVRSHYLALKHAVRIIEFHYLGKCAMMKQRSEFLLQRKSAVVLQAVYRGHICRKKMSRYKAAATVVQSTFRMYVAKRSFSEKKLAAEFIQSYYRSYVVLKRDRGSYQIMKRGFLRLQAHFRGSRIRKEVQMWHDAALKIQSAFKGWRQRKHFAGLKRACICVQRRFRGKMLTSKQVANYQQIRQSVVVIQSFTRGCLARKIYRRIKAAVVIQAKIRQYLARKSYMKLKSACIKIQSAFKGWRERKHFANLKRACISVQRRFRGKMLTSKQVADYQQIRQSVVVIQSFTRGCLARKAYRRIKAAVVIQSKIRQYLARKSYMKLKSACIKIQACIRMHLQRRSFQKMKREAIILQQYYRAWKQMKLERAEFLSKRKHVTVLQAHFRRMVVQKSFNQKRNAAIVVQSFYRMTKQRQMFQRQVRSVLLIQQKFRAYRLAKQERNNFVKLRAACITLQAFFRMSKVRKQYKELRHAALVIQVRYRAMCLCKEQRTTYLNYRKKAVILQAFARGAVARKKYVRTIKSCVLIQSHFRRFREQKKYQNLQKATLCLQKYVRQWIAGRKIRQDYLSTRQSIVVIQSCVRSFLVRKEFRRKQNACVVLQSHIRAWLMRKQYVKTRNAALVVQLHYRALKTGRQIRLQYMIMKKSAICIQSWWRAVVIRKSYTMVVTSTIIIQNHFRSWSIARKIRLQYCAMRNAAVVIQNAWKAHQARKRFLAVTKCAITIQKSWRNYQLAKNVRQQFLCKRASAVTIQRSYRSHLRKQCAAKIIQAVFRQYRVRSRYKRMRQSAIKIQSWIRCVTAKRDFHAICKATVILQQHMKAFLVGKKARQEYLHIRADIITAQASVRGFLVRKRYQKNQSARKIQSWYRGVRQRRNFVRIRNAVYVLQKYIKAYLVGKKVRQEYLRLRACVIIVQACVRAVLTRKVFQMHLAARKIQTWYRGAVQRRAYLKTCQAVCTLQTRVRCSKLGRKVRKEYLEYQRNVITVQACVRHFLAKKQYQKHLSARKIQTWYRGCVQRRKFCLIKQKGTLIQAVYRGYCARQRYEKLRKCCVVIQRKWRLILEARKNRQRKYDAAAVIQKSYRLYLKKKRYLQNLILTVKIQSHIRGYLIRKRILDQKHSNAATTIQTAFRGFLARKKFQTMKELQQRRIQVFSALTLRYLSAVRIQRCYRQYHLRNYAEQRLHFVITIQSWCRGYLQRKRYLKLRSCTVVFQRSALFYIRKRSNAACLIQSYVRTWLAQKQLMKIKKAVVTIQSAWKGYFIRSQNRSKQVICLRKRIKEATAMATEDMTLGNRVHRALDYLLKMRNLSNLLVALKHLDTTTRLSPICCERFVEAGGSSVLIQLMGSCNRSLPHMELIKFSTNILLNVAKYDKTVDSIWNAEGCVDTILELMSIFREKGSVILTKACSLLWILCQDPLKAEIIKRNSGHTDKICSLHYLITRKHKIEEQRLALKSKLSQNQSFSFLSTSMSFVCHPKERDQQIQPDWMLGKHIMREFEDPVVAITAVLNTLGLKKKELQRDRKTDTACVRSKRS